MSWPPTSATEDCPNPDCDASISGLFDYEVEDADEGEIRLRMTCHECGQQWNEYYNHAGTHVPEKETA